MATHLSEHLAVATCIACGARSRGGECPGGCTDVPLDLVDVGALEELSDYLRALEARVTGLRAVAEMIATGSPSEWSSVRARARSALSLRLPSAVAEPAIIEAWGCPECGRIDAPQPCLGVCVRQPVLVADAAEYRALSGFVSRLSLEERALTALADLVARVTPRPGHESETQKAFGERARASLSRTSASRRATA